MNVREIKNTIKQLHFTPKKFLGQHFLINTVLIQEIVIAVKDINPSFIVEVGPGLGALTKPLIALNIPLAVVEKDITLCRYWEDQVFVIKGDILHFKWIEYLHQRSLLIGNLPYQVASRLLVQCSQNVKHLRYMVLMFQKEVAERICAKPYSKKYGMLSVLSQCVWDIEWFLEASPKDFYPQPKVSSQVLLFKKKPVISIVRNLPEFTDFIKLCFTQRRKFLFNRLKKKFGISHTKGVFNKIGLSLSVRAEEVSVDQFVCLFRQLY